MDRYIRIVIMLNHIGLQQGIAEEVHMTRFVESKGLGVDLAAITILNFLLTIATLGLYFFWGRTAIRRYLWETTFIDSEPLSYRGTGFEKLLAVLATLFYLALLGSVTSLLFVFVQNSDVAVSLIFLSLVIPVIFFIRPFLQYRSLQCIASRTTLRGMSWSMHGTPHGYASRYAIRLLLTICTLGLAYPWFRAGNWNDRVNSTFYGNTPWSSDSSGKKLLVPWLICYATIVPTLGLSFFFYRAHELQYLTSSTSLTGVKFTVKTSIIELAWLTLSSLLLTFASLGLGRPWILARQIRWWSSHIHPEKPLDYSNIRKPSYLIAPILGDLFFAEGLTV